MPVSPDRFAGRSCRLVPRGDPASAKTEPALRQAARQARSRALLLRFLFPPFYGSLNGGAVSGCETGRGREMGGGMSESIFVRVQRVISAGADSAVSVAERASGSGLMREAIRQVERAADEVRDEQDKASMRRRDAGRQQRLVRDRIDTLKEQARFALSKGRDDLAEAAVATQIEHEKELARLKQVEAEAVETLARLDGCLAELKLKKAQMEKELAGFQAARTGSAGAADKAERAARRAARAEEAFERAMTAAGGVAARVDADCAAKLAEVEALRREAEVAARLAELKAKQQTASAGEGKRRSKGASGR